MSLRRRIEKGFALFGTWVLRNRVLCITASLALSIALGSQLGALRVDNSEESFLRPDDPARVAFDAFKEHYGSDENIAVVFRPTRIFELGFLEQLRAIHRDIEQDTPYVADITSLVNARNTRGEEDGLVVEELMEDWPETAEDLAALRARVFDNPLYVNYLISDSERVTVIWVKPFTYSTLTAELDTLAGFDEDEGSESHRPVPFSVQEEAEMLESLREIVARHTDPEDEVWVSGGPAINEAMARIMNRDVSKVKTVRRPDFFWKLLFINGLGSDFGVSNPVLSPFRVNLSPFRPAHHWRKSTQKQSPPQCLPHREG